LSDRKNRFADLTFNGFIELAMDKSLSKYEKIGFPDAYRAGKEGYIFQDIVGKLPALRAENKAVLDIGPGCSDLPEMLINLCQQNKHDLMLIDSAEMLAYLPDGPSIKKIAALYPDCPEIIVEMKGKIDVIVCYSVLHYILVDVAFFRFLDISLSLLAPGGHFLIGDIPNISKRKRFFASQTGIRFHQEFMQTTDLPSVSFNKIEHDQVDDAVVFAILQRARAQGFDAYILPQNPNLPMANRREDVLIVCP
jgi:hypothetical protein